MYLPLFINWFLKLQKLHKNYFETLILKKLYLEKKQKIYRNNKMKETSMQLCLVSQQAQATWNMK